MFRLERYEQMKVKLNSINTELDFADVGNGTFVSPTLMQQNEFGKWAPGAIELSGATSITKKGIRTITIAVRAPVPDFKSISPNIARVTADSTANDGPKFVQCRLTITIPNEAPVLYETPSGGDATPPNQGSANAVALAQAMETLLVCVANQGSSQSPTLATGAAVFSAAGVDTGNPAYLGAIGAFPIGSNNRELVAQATA